LGIYQPPLVHPTYPPYLSYFLNPRIIKVKEERLVSKLS